MASVSMCVGDAHRIQGLNVRAGRIPPVSVVRGHASGGSISLIPSPTGETDRLPKMSTRRSVRSDPCERRHRLDGGRLQSSPPYC